jgi:hypothetical protein
MKRPRVAISALIVRGSVIERASSQRGRLPGRAGVPVGGGRVLPFTRTTESSRDGAMALADEFHDLEVGRWEMKCEIASLFLYP